ncbi:hypothetical protein NDU88_004021 [Pleurodeles waltl]|uniref:Uncharacterized protein n=1 Tax=Pleurodeles waltl TaxID=8319 RepID=A0AAV7M8P3_PLEWA|nr:hypothetical protein NDU88_004021 [Pleurodeles waltl]
MVSDIDIPEGGAKKKCAAMKSMKGVEKGPEKDVEKALEGGKKRRRLEAEMVVLLQRKKEFDDVLKKFKIPAKPSLSTDVEEEEAALEVPATPDPQEAES